MMEKKQRRELSEREKTNQDIKRQVYLIAETILGIAKGVEEALVNITAVRGVLSRITHKLNQQEFICEEERALLALTEQWLNEEKIRSKQDNGGHQSIGQVNLSQISALGSSFLSAATTEHTSCSHLSTPSINKRFSVGSTQTLNEGEELVWDGNGVELTESFHSAYSGATTRTAFSRNPFELCKLTNLLDSDESSGNSAEGVKKTSSYQGIYEEEMEFTLEVEEGFYSDSSSHAFDDDVCDFSPQADSGVTHLDSHASTDRSISHPDDELTVTADLRTGSQLSLEVPTYNRDVNTWDMYGTVNLEEDLFSTASSANNSNTSTPRLVRKRKSPILSPKQDSKTESQPQTPSKAVIEPIKDIAVCTQSTMKSDNQITTDIQEIPIIMKSSSRASTFGRNQTRTESQLTNLATRKISESSPTLSSVSSPATDLTVSSAYNTRDNGINGQETACNSEQDVHLTNGFDNSSTSSQASSKLSIGTSILADGYLKSSHKDLQENLSLPEALRRNNYQPKSRKPVFV